MAKFVKEGAFGGYRDVPGGQSDPECTHVILKLKEYEKMLHEQARAEQEARSTNTVLRERLKRRDGRLATWPRKPLRRPGRWWRTWSRP